MSERSNDYELALSRLDRLHSSVNIGDITDVVGVLADIKPSSVISHEPQLAEVVNDLGLSSYMFGYDDVPVEEMTVSKEPDLAQELAHLFTHGGNSDDEFRRIGKLLGYPESATEYFIRRYAAYGEGYDGELPFIIPEPIEGTIHDDFCQLVLSPEHWREEIEAYVLPLARATQDLAPETFRKLNRSARRRKITRKILRIVGVKPSPFSSDVKVQYVK